MWDGGCSVLWVEMERIFVDLIWWGFCGMGVVMGVRVFIVCVIDVIFDLV